MQDMRGETRKRTSSSREKSITTVVQHYEQIAAAAGDILLTIDMAGNILYISPSVECIGYAPPDILGQPFRKLVHPDWQDRIVESYQNQISEQLPQTILEFPLLNHIGKPRWFKQITILNTDNGRVIGLHAHLQSINVPELNTAQPPETFDHFLMIAEKANVALFVVRNGQFVYANQAMSRLLHCVNGDLSNTNLFDFIPPDSRLHIDEMFQTRLQGTDVINSHELRILCKDNQERWIDLTTAPITFEKLPAVIGTAFDITDRKLEEIQRKTHIERLEIIQQVDTELTKLLKFDYVLKIALEAAVDITHADAGAIHLVEGHALRVAQVIGNFPSSMIGSSVPVDRGLVGRVFRNTPN
jgi:PAS domain S-box-containing protein